MDLRNKSKDSEIQDKQSEIKQVNDKTERMRRYRQKLKTERSDTYEKMKEKDKERKRLARSYEKEQRKSDKQKLKKDRQKWKEQKKRYRMKQKEKMPTVSQNVSEKNDKNTKQTQKKPKIDRRNLLQSRARLEQKKRENAVMRTKLWRLKIKLKDKSSSTNEETESDFSSRASQYRAVKKAQASLPSTPRRKSKVIEKIINSSPRTQKTLEAKGVIISNQVRKRLHMGEALLKSFGQKIKEMKKRGTPSNEKRPAYRNLLHAALGQSVARYHKFGSAIASYLSVRNKTLQTTSQWWKMPKRKPRKDKIPESVSGQIKKFYLSQSVSRENPNKKDVMKVNGEPVHRHIMNMTLSEAYDRFKEEYPEVKVGLTTFKKEKPPQVKIVNEISHRSCLCQVCCNLALKVDALKKHANEKKNVELEEQVKNLNKIKVSDITLCRYTELPASKCLNRTCENCGPQKISQYLENSTKQEEMIQWYKWESVQIEDKNKNCVKRVTSCVGKTTTIAEFMKDFQNDLTKYPSHIFRATWQHKQMQLSQESLKEGQLIMMEDFSENYRCRFQNESQNAYFDQMQVTVHPFMCYYLDKECEQAQDDQKRRLVKHSIVAISDDTNHDAFAVQSFERKALEVLDNENKVSEIIKFSDGCAAQYKGKNSFAHLSLADKKTSRHYFETSHGKSPCDGLGAVVKNTCFNAVKSGKAVIGSAEDVYDYCRKTLDKTKVVGKGDEQYVTKRNMIYVQSSEIKREDLGAKTVAGTRSLHAARSTGSPFKIQTRNLSCFCRNCLTDEEPCANKEYVGEWTASDLCVLSRTKQKQNLGAEVSAKKTNNTDSLPATFTDEDSLLHKATTSSRDMQGNGEVHATVGGFVLVQLSTKKGRHSIVKQFVAQVQDIDEGEVKLSYMLEKTVKNQKYYYWPEKEDVSWEDKKIILKSLADPKLSNKSSNRNLLFTVNI